MVFSLTQTSWADASRIDDIRIWTAPDHSRLVFDLSQPIEYELFRLHKPERIVIDCKDARLSERIGRLELPDPVIQSLRYGNPKPKILRIVLDVKEHVKPRSFLLKAMQGKPYRLVVDLMRSGDDESRKAIVTGPSQSRRDIVIAVDAGHGGEDPGAIGRNGLKEKTVTLSVAKELAAAINAKPGMRAILTRSGDYFVPLAKRVKLANKANADMMISIHADSVRDRKVKGASVYTLSERGATPDRVAAALAAKENASDAIGGVIPDEEEVADPVVTMILGDLKKRESLNSSQIFAEQILKDIGKVGPLKYDMPKRARFVVLSNPLRPSVLVELDYISNPSRERKLRSRSYQKRLAEALMASSLSHLRAQGRLPTHLASNHSVPTRRSHTVHRGESLWSIANRYGISISTIRTTNHLKSSELRIGQHLIVPSI